eukprot:TRINITY_DN2898_c0_g1_i2.p2 TRINITY_DN2898_c0_g1~~TRINITY_DN2898_c0_g1_i2.p2  ORF type:complete len:118 (+),score=41.25 TRINITY_DN2898_c0_g1_i2:61-414(+)
MSKFYSVVGPRTSGFRSVFTKQRMKDWEPYMVGFGGHGGHRFCTTPSNDMYVVRQTTWMDTRLEPGGLLGWINKMKTKIWKRVHFQLPAALFGFCLVWGIWEAAILESQRFERAHYY